MDASTLCQKGVEHMSGMKTTNHDMNTKVKRREYETLAAVIQPVMGLPRWEIHIGWLIIRN
jgi:hypothetical protein